MSDEIQIVSIRELKHTATEEAREFVVHAQLDTVAKKSTRGGAPFYQLNFADSEESLVLRAWENSSNFKACDDLAEKQFFAITGEFYQNLEHRSIDTKSWDLRLLTGDEAAGALAGSTSLRAKQEADYAFICNTTAGVSDPRLSALCALFLNQFGERFRRTGAARKNHHARRGGLVEHVAQMMRTAVQVCIAYPMLNRDLMVTGVLFHDVGKLWENCYDADGFTMPFTEVSELLSHIPFGMEIVNKLWRDLESNEELSSDWKQLDPASSRVRLHLLHLVASHHGELQYGAPVVPKTPEAQALHYIDNLDAKMEMFEQGYVTSPEIARNVQERVFPLPGKLVRPLEKFDGPEAEAIAPEPVVQESAVVAEEAELETPPEIEVPEVKPSGEPVSALSEAELEAKVAALGAGATPIADPTEEEMAGAKGSSEFLPIPEPTEEEMAELEKMMGGDDEDGAAPF